ncbi:acetylornithine deacetylase [Ophiostoma piceae UAMH 11346]|uniref:Acetylornithine deacetylase n=1 Tax=Ophiostoma piceae (strain UAMH 11346) TaxID=1262450 RepID=S3D7Y0_OPHP1|nr:acetylornithine deacetylase [Ophiostoma piceae UAMH 11346]
MAPLIAPHVPNPLTDPVVSPAAAAVTAFHRQLPHYAATPLRSLPALAAEIGVGQLYLKDESDRFGLPSFKILGASWAVHCALARAIGLPQSVSLAKLADAVRAWNADTESIAKGEKKELRILGTTEGNWGRAVARMAQYVGQVPCRLYVPTFMLPATQEILRLEGAEVHVLQGKNYDDCVAYVQAEAEREGSILILDVGFDGYEDVPQWVVEGYETMLVETDEQVLEATGGHVASHVVVPVGVGSIAQAVTQHYKGKSPNLYKKISKVITGSTRTIGAGGATTTNAPTTSHAEALWDGKHGIKPEQQTVVMAVEADTAACLRASLAVGRRVTVATADTIMCGLNCGTLSKTAWPILQRGIDYSVAVSDRQAHAAVQHLLHGSSNPRNSINKMKTTRRTTNSDNLGGDSMADDAGCSGGVAAGPCGAATLAGLRQVCSDARDVMKLDGDSIVVLFCTEGPRPYEVPFV